jgi:hypothetical protein
MGIPSAVARQAELSEQIRKEAYEKKPKEELETDPLETPPIEEEPPIEEPPVKGPDYQALYEEEKQRRMTLEGKYNSEIPDLIQSNRAFAEQIADLKTEISGLKKKEPPLPEPDEAEFAALQEQFPEVTKLTAIQLRREISKKDQKILLLEGRLEKLEAGVTTVTRRVERTEGQGFEKEMDTLVDKRGNWRQMNTPGSEFLKWVGTEMIHGHSRYDLMTSSYQRQDFKAVASHFNDFIAMKNPKKKEEVEEEENLGLPKPGSHGRPPVDDKKLEDKKTITRSFVAKTLKDIALKQKYKNDPKEAKRLQALIDDKQAKGLIVDG